MEKYDFVAKFFQGEGAAYGTPSVKSFGFASSPKEEPFGYTRKFPFSR